MKKLLFILCCALLQYSAWGQYSSLEISGTTNKRIDYFTKDNKLRKKYDIKDLGHVNIKVLKGSKVVTSTESNAKGEFSIKFDFSQNEIYDLKFSKSGYYSKKSRIRTLNAEMGYNYFLQDFNIALRAKIEGLKEQSPLLPFERYNYDTIEENFIVDYEYEMKFDEIQQKIYARIEQEVKTNDAYANLREGALDELQRELNAREAESRERVRRLEQEKEREIQLARRKIKTMIAKARDSLNTIYTEIKAEKNQIANAKPQVEYVYVDSSEPSNVEKERERALSRLNEKRTLEEDDMNRAGLQIIRRRDELKDARKQLQLKKLLAKTKEDSLLIQQREQEIMMAENELLNFEAKVKDVNQKLQLQQLTVKNQRMILYGLIGFLVLLFGFFIIVYRLYNEKKKVNNLLSEKNDEIEEKNADIMASIRYAQRIQTAILPPKEIMDDKIHGDYFVLYKPKDIVSGDFYWMLEKDNKLYVSVIDCTGHGVPGAFMSMIGYNSLNKAVAEYENPRPNEILDRQNKFVADALRKDSNPKIRDGMDMALLCIDYEQKTVEYAGAYNALYVVRNGEMIHIRSNNISIGSYYQDPSRRYDNHSLELQAGDCFYIFTDGYADQFGGPDYKKYMHSNFRKLLVNINDEPMKKQKEILWNTIEDWRGDEEQIDDICVLGIRFL